MAKQTGVLLQLLVSNASKMGCIRSIFYAV